MSTAGPVDDGHLPKEGELTDRDTMTPLPFLAIRHPVVQFLVLTVCIFAVYSSYGYLQEFIVSSPDWRFGWSLTLFQFLCAALLSFLFLLFFSRDKSVSSSDSIKAVPVTSNLVMQYLLVGFLQVVSMGFSNAALAYLNYPTQVLFKTSKLIPVMLGGVLILGKSYQLVEYLSVISIVLGLSAFTLADANTRPNFHPIGVLLLCSALVGDALIGNVEENMLKNHGVGLNYLIFYTHLIGSLLLIVYVSFTGEIGSFIDFIMQEGLFWKLLAFGMLSCLGMSLIMLLLERFGCLVAVTVTSCRKVATVVFSFIMFPKPFSWYYVLGGVLVFGGIVLNVYIKNRPEIQALLVGSKITLK